MRKHTGNLKRITAFVLAAALLAGNTVTVFADAPKDLPTVTTLNEVNKSDEVKEISDLANQAAAAADAAADAAKAVEDAKKLAETVETIIDGASDDAASAVGLDSDKDGVYETGDSNIEEKATDLVKTGSDITDILEGTGGNDGLNDKIADATTESKEATKAISDYNDVITDKVDATQDALDKAVAQKDIAVAAGDYATAKTAADASAVAAAEAKAASDEAEKLFNDAKTAITEADVAVKTAEDALAVDEATVSALAKQYADTLKVVKGMISQMESDKKQPDIMEDYEKLLSGDTNFGKTNVDQLIAQLEKSLKLLVKLNEVSAADVQAIKDAALTAQNNADAAALAAAALAAATLAGDTVTANVAETQTAAEKAEKAVEDIEKIAKTGKVVSEDSALEDAEYAKAGETLKAAIANVDAAKAKVGAAQTALTKAQSDYNTYYNSIAAQGARSDGKFVDDNAWSYKINKGLGKFGDKDFVKRYEDKRTNYNNYVSALNTYDGKVKTANNSLGSANAALTNAKLAKTAADNAMVKAQLESVEAMLLNLDATKVDSISDLQYTEITGVTSTTVTTDETTLGADEKALVEAFTQTYIADSSADYNEIYNDVQQYFWAVDHRDKYGDITEAFKIRKEIENKYPDLDWISWNSFFWDTKNKEEITEEKAEVKEELVADLTTDYMLDAAYEKVDAAKAQLAANEAELKAQKAAQDAIEAQAKYDAAVLALENAKKLISGYGSIQDMITSYRGSLKNYEIALNKYEAAKEEFGEASEELEIAQTNEQDAKAAADEAAASLSRFNTTPSTPSTPAVVQTVAEVAVITEAPVALAAVPVAASTKAKATVKTDAVEETEEVTKEAPVVIEEEETPLVPEVAEETTEIVEEEVPLAVLSHQDCLVHWIILALSLLYGAFATVRTVARFKKIEELSAKAENVRA